MGNRAFWRSFVCRRFGCGGGARDFFWLTLLLALVISMALLLVGSRAGLLERFTDAILGTLRPHGVPIWVTAHWENHEGIQTNLLNRLKDLEKRLPGESFGISVHPYRRLAQNSPQIRLPVESVWSSGAPWVGWAVYADDPLWNLVEFGGEIKPATSLLDFTGTLESINSWLDLRSVVMSLSELVGLRTAAQAKTTYTGTHNAEKTSANITANRDEWQGLPLTIVLSESLFAKQFDYATYREVMQPELQKRKLRRLPMTLPNGILKNTLHTLWLKVRVGDREDLVPFQVRWVHHIPGMEKVAYLFPLTTYHALLAAYHFPDLHYDPITKGKGNADSFKKLTSRSFPRRAIATYAQCIQSAVAATGLTDLPKVGEKQCPRPNIAGYSTKHISSLTPFSRRGRTAGSRRQATNAKIPHWDTLNHDADNHLWLPCQRLPRSNALRGTLCPEELSTTQTSAQTLFVPWDVTADGTSFAAIHVYVPDPTRLSRGIKGLLALRTPENLHALSIQTMYQDALNRFNLLSDLLSTMVPAYALTFGLFLSALLLAQVGTLIGHRRHHYGILLSRGFTWAGIYAKLLLQMSLATLTGGCVSIIVFIPILRTILDDGFKSIIINYQDLLPPGYDFEVLPLPWQPILLTIGQVFAAVFVVTILLLVRLPLRGNTAPSDLLHGDNRGANTFARERERMRT